MYSFNAELLLNVSKGSERLDETACLKKSETKRRGGVESVDVPENVV